MTNLAESFGCHRPCLTAYSGKGRRNSSRRRAWRTLGESMPPSTPFTQLLAEWRGGNQDAGQQLFAAAYQELRRLAAWHLKQERPGHTLQPTALVHELYVTLFGRESVDWTNRAHFFSVAA